VALIVGFAVAVALTPVCAMTARRLDIVDRPGPLKVQSTPVPYLGGLAVLAALLGPVLWTRPALAIPLALATGLGLADDIADLHSRIRLVCELAIGVVVAVVTGVPGGLAVVAVVATVLLVNAVNLLDGLDGLASGTALVSGAGFAFVVEGDYRVLAVALAAALGGFLVWNRPPARIYLGDSGSYLIGTALAVLLAATLGDQSSASSAAAAALLVGVPVGDTAIAVVRRWRAKRPLFTGDRGHVYDQLVDRRWTPRQATLACIGAQAALAVLAVAVSHAADGVAVGAAVVIVLGVAAWALPTFTSPASSTS
jgi:UDP-GlcNAc:undecaprenyl-phosphate GlcNAc-1-phosphate transferase